MKGLRLSALLLYLAGVFILLAGLSIGAFLVGVPLTWIVLAILLFSAASLLLLSNKGARLRSGAPPEPPEPPTPRK